MEIRRKKATRFNDQRMHDQYGIYVWFYRRRIKDTKIIFSLVSKFISSNQEDFNKSNNIGSIDDKKFRFVADNFQKFASFCGNELKNRNGNNKK